MKLSDTEPQRAEEVLKDAELAMYHAKRGGGDRIDVFKAAMRARKSDRLTIESDLRRALERDEIASSISRSCGSRIARSPASKRWRAGTIRNSGGYRRSNSSRSPRKPG